MMLYLKTDYHSGLLFKSEVMDAAIKAIGGAVKVTTTNGYGSPDRYEMDHDAESLEIKLISDDSFSLPDNQTALAEKFAALSKDKDDANVRRYNAEKERDKYKATAESLQERLDSFKESLSETVSEE